MTRETKDPREARPWALVTGGSRGIGRGVCLELAQRGWNVALWYLRNDDRASQVQALVREQGAACLAQRVNVANEDDISNAFGSLLEETGTPRLTGIVHCAGLGALASTLGARRNRWTLAWDTHVGGLLHLVQVAREHLVGPAAVVAVSSTGMHKVTPGYAPIAAAKASLETLVRYLAAELAEQGVRVNAVRAGPVDTDSLRSFPWYDDAVRASERSPAARLAEPEDIARVVAFLLGDDSRWIQGQVITADGGQGLV